MPHFIFLQFETSTDSLLPKTSKSLPWNPCLAESIKSIPLQYDPHSILIKSWHGNTFNQPLPSFLQDAPETGSLLSHYGEDKLNLVLKPILAITSRNVPQVRFLPHLVVRLAAHGSPFLCGRVRRIGSKTQASRDRPSPPRMGTLHRYSLPQPLGLPRCSDFANPPRSRLSNKRLGFYLWLPG